MLLIGVGAIGERTARLARAFGMRVVGVKRDPSQTVAGIETMVGWKTWEVCYQKQMLSS